jgi:hypothetical protein
MTGHQGWSQKHRPVDQRRCTMLQVGVAVPLTGGVSYQACQTGSSKWSITLEADGGRRSVSRLELEPRRSIRLDPCDDARVWGAVEGVRFDEAVQLCRTHTGLTVGPVGDAPVDREDSTTPGPWIVQIFDPRRKLAGRIYERSRGVLEARDDKHRVVGTYDPAINQTRDAGRRLVAYGNVLSHLIMRTKDGP